MSQDKQLKEAIAAGIKRVIRNGIIMGDIDKDKFKVLNIELGTQTLLSMRIKVRTNSTGTHWYTISIKEDM